MNDKVVHNYGWSNEAGPGSCNYIAPAVLRILGSLGARRVVDVGAGNGALCGTIAATGVHVAGIEYDAAGVEVARRAHPSIRFYQYGVADNPAQVLAAELAPFDVVVSTEVVEHLYAPHLLPQFARGLLRKGGHLVISTPYHGYAKNLTLSLFGKWDRHHTALWHGGHIKFWSKRTLGQLLEQNGYDVTEFVGVGRMSYFWKSMILVARQREER